MPRSIVERADQVLHQLEESSRASSSPATPAITPARGATEGGGYQMTLFQLDDPLLAQIRDEILHTDINNLTPLAALAKLNDIKALITGH